MAAMLFAVFLAPASWARPGGKEYEFKGTPDGAFPYGGLVSDGNGNFYGTTQGVPSNACGNNASSCGTVFSMTREENGTWSYRTLHTFMGGTDGAVPMGPLALDNEGNVYGTAAEGGNPNFNCYCGTVFRLSPNQDGTWTNTTLYGFQGGADGAGPMSGVAFDTAGDLYGTTSFCSLNVCGGTAFQLTPTQGGNWTKTTVYTFPFLGQPSEPGPLILDAAGNLYGTTRWGGSANYGTVFQLVPSQDGTWTENILYNFADGLDGGSPTGGIIFDGKGNLYGEASWGGSLACPVYGCGTVFELTPDSNGGWQFSVVHTFNGLNGARGEFPTGGLALDGSGSLYGTTMLGGDLTCLDGGCGTVFELTPSPGGATFRIIASFDGKHGADPGAGVILDSAGNLYGTAEQGGDIRCGQPNGCGVVFLITP